MKKLLLSIFISMTLFASDTKLATKIYLSIAKACTDKSDPKFYLHGDVKELRDNKAISRVNSCEEADIVILSTMKRFPAECKKKLLFTTHYRTFSQNPEIIGAFFWQKGRPNIIFHRESLEKHHILLDSSYDKYME